MAVISTDDVGLTWIRFGSIPLIVTLVLPLILGVFILLKCILNHLNHCCVRKSTTKEEMYGLEGRMTILPNVESSFVPSPPHGPQQQQQPLPMTSISSQTSPVPNINVNFQQIKQPKRQQKCDNRHSLSSQPASLKLKHDVISNGTITIPISPTSSAAAAITTIITTTTSTIPGEAQSDSYETVDLSDSLKRSTLHPNRQLPDLPQLPNLQVHNPPRRSSSVLSHDGTSELYATVGEEVPHHPDPETEIGISNYYNAASSRKSAPVRSSSRGNKHVDGPSTSGSSSSHNNNTKNSKNEPTPSSDSETYSGVNAMNHPYAKLKRNVVEHPYARVRTGSTGAGGDEETDTDNYDTPQPYAQTTRTRNPPLPISSSRPLATLQSNVNNVLSSSSHGNNGNIDGISQPSLSSASSTNNHDTNPVPPRRTGRQWRRSSHPQAQPNNDNQPNFSGDSQDSRGYTSISVREPLSNIIANRSQVANTRNYDSHYATVSDDSEEMYAAIEDSDGNYMRIPGEDGNRHWLGGSHLASPIPERREANSPLPPPPIKPPEISPTAPSLLATIDGSQSASSSHASAPSNSNPPLYAQVTKKNKKGNIMSAPLTTTNPSSSQQANNNNNAVSTNDMKGSTIIPGSSSPASSGVQVQASSSSSMSKNRHTVSENTATLLSPVDPASSEPRRWSKADISYSEFEVVREPLFSQSNITRNSGHSVTKSDRTSSSSSTPHHHNNHHHHNIHHISTSPPPPPLPQHQQLGKTASSSSESKNLLSGNLNDKHKKQEEQLLDEDNYNVIPEPGRPSRHGRGDESGVKGHSAKSSIKKVHKISTHSSDNYQEIDDVDFHSSNAYQEIERKEPSDYYQEIGASAVLKIEGSSRLHHHHNDLNSNLYQEIDKKTPRSVDLLEDEEDEDPTDQLYESNLYETVKPVPISSSSSSNKSKFMNIPSPSHSQVSMSSLDRKHGYEKLRKKVSSNLPNSSASGHQKTEVSFKTTEFDDDDATTDDEDEDIRDAKWHKKSISESSKKKQRFGYEEHKRLTVDSTLEDDEDDDDDEAKNEDFMYERVKYPHYEYERLKESRDDLRELDLEDDDGNDKNLYEHIGYSRVMKPKSKNTKKLAPKPNAPFSSESSIVMPSQNRDDDNQLRTKNPSQRLVQDIEAKEFSPAYSSKSSHNQSSMMMEGGGGAGTAGEMDLDQLYARVDKSKKRKHNIDNSSTTTNVRDPEEGAERGTATTTSSAINFSSSSSSSRVIEIREDNPHQACILLRTDRDEEEEDNSIEYI